MTNDHTTLAYKDNYTEIEDYIIPFSQLKIELEVLSKLLSAATENIKRAICAAVLPDMFTEPTCRRMIRIIKEYTLKNGYSDLSIEAIDMFYFGEDNKVIDLKIAGLLAELSIMQEECICVSDWSKWVKWLHKSYEKRLISECKTLKDIENAKQIISSVSIQENINALANAPNKYTETYEDCQNCLIKTYFSSIDSLIGGFTPGNLILLGARPAIGKTLTALNLALSMARHNISSLFIELEMTSDEIMQRLNGNLLNISLKRFRDRQLTDEELCKFQNFHISEKGKKFRNLISMPEKCKPNILEIENTIRNSKADVIFVDHIGLVSGESKGSKYESTTEVVERLKTLALEIQKPIIALCQLNRAVTTREDPRPKLSDLRDSGALEQSSDIVLFAHRDSYYNPSLPDNKLELIIGKSRSTGGAGQIITLNYNPIFQRLTDPQGETREKYTQCKIT